MEKAPEKEIIRAKKKDSSTWGTVNGCEYFIKNGISVALASVTIFYDNDGGYETIYNMNEIEFEPSDLREILKVGQVVEFNDFTKGYVLQDRIVKKNETIMIKSLDETLSCIKCPSFKIIKIFNAPERNENAWNFNSSDSELELVWKRPKNLKRKIKLNEKEKTILESVDGKIYKYIAKTPNSKILFCEKIPAKRKAGDKDYWVGTGMEDYAFAFQKDLFEFIKFEDDPMLIEDLLKL